MNSSFRHSTASLLTVCLLLLHVWVLPAQAFWNFGIKDEKELGHKFEVLIRSQLPLIEDPEVALYIDSLVKKLAKVIPPQPFPFTSGVVLHNSMNAFAVPGGHVFVFSGLILNLDSETELVGVLAHEMAHVTQRHVAARIERGRVMTLAALLAAVAGIAVGGQGGAALMAGGMGATQSAMLNYSRIDENEADHIGYQYVMAAGYPLQGMVTAFQKIRQKSIMAGSNVPTYLSTHPDLGDRIAGIVARLKSAPANIQSRTSDNTRFKRVQTLLRARYGDTQAAAQIFRQAPASDCLARMGMGMVFSRENKIQEAGLAFDKALACTMNDPLIMREAGAFHFRKGDTARAEQLLHSALEKDRHDYMTKFFYARLLDETGRSHHADAYYQEVLRALPHDQEVHTAYARSLGKSGKTFAAYLHMAYSALYGNDKKRVKQYADKARSQAKTPEDNTALARFDTRYKERKEIWDQGM